MSQLVLDDDYNMLPVIDLADDDRMITSSKAAYLSQFPKNMIAFNGGICTKSKGNIWNGDLDVTRDYHQLQQIATELGEDLYIFLERDYVTERENIKWDAALKVVRKPRRKKVPTTTTEPAETIETDAETEEVGTETIAAETATMAETETTVTVEAEAKTETIEVKADAET